MGRLVYRRLCSQILVEWSERTYQVVEEASVLAVMGWALQPLQYRVFELIWKEAAAVTWATTQSRCELVSRASIA